MLLWSAAVAILFSGYGVPAARAVPSLLDSAVTDRSGLPPADAPPAPKTRVLMAEDAKATTRFQPNPEVVQRLFDRALARFTTKPDVKSAWLSLVKPGDVIGIKVFSKPGASSGTRPSLVAAMVRGLLAAGVPGTNIIVWDKNESDLRAAGYYAMQATYGVEVESAIQAGYDETVSYTNAVLGVPIWGDLEFGRTGEGIGRRSYVTKLVTKRITKIICVSPLLNHNVMGITGCLSSLALGAVDNSVRFTGSLDQMAVAIPEIYALPELGDRVVLNVIDALICQYEGEQQSLLHYSSPLNQVWLGTDPVALDVMGLQELTRQRELAGQEAPRSPMRLYYNASALEIGVSDPVFVKIEKFDATQ